MSAGLAAKRAFASAVTAKMQIATVSGTMKDPASTIHENHTRPVGSWPFEDDVPFLQHQHDSLVRHWHEKADFEVCLHLLVWSLCSRS